MGDVGVDGRIILKRVLDEYGVSPAMGWAETSRRIVLSQEAYEVRRVLKTAFGRRSAHGGDVCCYSCVHFCSFAHFCFSCVHFCFSCVYFCSSFAHVCLSCVHFCLSHVHFCLSLYFCLSHVHFCGPTCQTAS